MFFVLEINPLTIARKNARTIIKHSTAYPFRLPESLMMCILCRETFPNASQFRLHMSNEHETYRIQMAFQHVSDGQMKVDITELKCRLCTLQFNNLQQIADHLIIVHCKTIDLENDLGLQPYRFENEKLSCAVCQHKSPNIVALSRHTGSHFKSFICEHCGNAYATNGSLKYHLRNSCSKDGKIRCRKCRKVVSSMLEHFKESRLCRQHICSICGERFGTWHTKRVHMESDHSTPKKAFRCPECNDDFKSSALLRQHFNFVHTKTYLECLQCGLKFMTRKRLDLHMIVHTGEKIFVCDVCNKSYYRKSTLNQHMWVHSEIKRHSCKICEKSFNQGVCLRVHMKSQHPTVSLTQEGA